MQLKTGPTHFAKSQGDTDLAPDCEAQTSYKTLGYAGLTSVLDGEPPAMFSGVIQHCVGC